MTTTSSAVAAAAELAARLSPSRVLTPRAFYDQATAIPVRDHFPASAELDGSLIITVHASSQATLASVRRLDLTRPVARALHALDLVHRFALVPTRLDHAGARPLRIGGIWRVNGVAPGRRAAATEFDSFAHPGHVKVSWEIDVAPDEPDTELSIRTRFTATDEAASERLLDIWAIVGPLNDALTARAAHAVKRYTEDLEDGEEVGWP